MVRHDGGRLMKQQRYDILIWLTAENSYWNNVSLWLIAEKDWLCTANASRRYTEEENSVFRSGGLLKEYGPRPRIATARPRDRR